MNGDELLASSIHRPRQASDLDGKPLDFRSGKTLARNRGVLATNGFLHADILRGMKAISEKE